jgi:hypothetical protein
VLVALLVALPLIRLAVYWWLKDGSGGALPRDLSVLYLEKPFHTRADGLVMGLLLAHLDVFGGSRWKRGFLSSRWVVVVGGVTFGALFRSPVLEYTGSAASFGACTWFLVARRYPFAVLESRAFYLLSRLSYGMYLNYFFLFGVADVALAATRHADVSCIMIWTQGGTSHHDTFDPKPDAPASVRGEYGDPLGSLTHSLDGWTPAFCACVPSEILRPTLSPPGTCDNRISILDKKVQFPRMRAGRWPDRDCGGCRR